MRCFVAIVLVSNTLFLYGIEDQHSLDQRFVNAVRLGDLKDAKGHLSRVTNMPKDLLSWALMIDNLDKRTQKFQWLLEQVALPDDADSRGSLLIDAAAMDCVEEVKMLLNGGVNINYTRDGRTALIYAVGYNEPGSPKKCCFKAMWMLVARGADIDIRGPDGKSAMDYMDQDTRKNFERYLALREETRSCVG